MNETGSVYRLTSLVPEDGAIFTKVDFSGTFEDFQKQNPSLRLGLDASPRKEGHTYIFVVHEMHPPYGIFVPDGVPNRDVLRQVRCRWGVLSEVNS